MSHKRMAQAAIVLLLSVWASPAWAQFATGRDSVIEEEEVDRSEYMITARARAIAVPGFILGIWFDEHATHWSEGQSNMAYGAEFAWRKRGDYELSFSFEWADLSMKPAFWRESGDTPDEARYTELDLQIASFVFASYWVWDPQPWLSPYVGGGIGAGVVLGGLSKYKATAGSACEAAVAGADPLRPPECFNAAGEAADGAVDRGSVEREDILPVVPILHAAAGLRFNIAEHGVIKLELGLNDYVYAGISVGGQWW